MNPTDNQTPQPVDDELDEIMKELREENSNSSWQEYCDEIEARLLQWGTEQYKKGYIDAGIASLKDGGNV